MATVGSASPYNSQISPPSEQAAPGITAAPDDETPAPPDEDEELSVTARIGDVAYVTTLARPTRGWRAIEAIFADDPGLTQIVVVRPGQIGGSYLIRRDDSIGASPPR